MPELLEVETYRVAADRCVGRRISAVPVIDELGLRGIDAAGLRTSVIGSTIIGTRRIGKLLLVDTDGPTIGLRFGMTGRLLVDDEAALGDLVYGSAREEERWDRLRLRFADGGDLRVRDPRRLGGCELDPDTGRLGPDAATISTPALRSALAGSEQALKARLLDQSRVAGLGNLLVDDALHRTGIAPTRASGSLTADEVRRLARGIRTTVATLGRRGGSHTGDLQPERHRDGRCPIDGTALRRETVGGRTTYWCPAHQC